MKRVSTIFLQVVILFVGIGTLAGLVREPLVEGRNVNATLFQIYFNDPFLAYVYIAFIPFFMALYQAFKLLGFVRQNIAFSLNSVKALRSIKYCALTTTGFIVGAEAYLFIVQRGKDDIAGGVAVGFFVIFISVVISAVADVLEGLLRSAIDTKSENNLPFNKYKKSI